MSELQAIITDELDGSDSGELQGGQTHHRIFVSCMKTPIVGDWHNAKIRWFVWHGSGVVNGRLSHNLKTNSLTDINNEQIGFAAGFHLPNAGDFKIVCQITDEEGDTYTASRSITIRESTRTVYYIDAETGNNESVAASIDRPLKTYDQASFISQLSAGNIEFRFKRGQVFEVTEPIDNTRPKDYNWGKNNNVVISSYGEGGKPIIMYTSPMVKDGEKSQSFDLLKIHNATVIGLQLETLQDALTGDNHCRLFSELDNVALIDCVTGNGQRAISNTDKRNGLLLIGHESVGQTWSNQVALKENSNVHFLGCKFLGSHNEQTVRLTGGKSPNTNITFQFSHFENMGKASIRLQYAKNITLNQVKTTGHAGVTLGFSDHDLENAQLIDCLMHTTTDNSFNFCLEVDNVGGVSVEDCTMIAGMNHGIAIWGRGGQGKYTGENDLRDLLIEKNTIVIPNGSNHAVPISFGKMNYVPDNVEFSRNDIVIGESFNRTNKHINVLDKHGVVNMWDNRYSKLSRDVHFKRRDNTETKSNTFDEWNAQSHVDDYRFDFDIEAVLNGVVPDREVTPIPPPVVDPIYDSFEKNEPFPPATSPITPLEPTPIEPPNEPAPEPSPPEEITNTTVEIWTIGDGKNSDYVFNLSDKGLAEFVEFMEGNRGDFWRFDFEERVNHLFRHAIECVSILD